MYQLISSTEDKQYQRESEEEILMGLAQCNWERNCRFGGIVELVGSWLRGYNSKMKYISLIFTSTEEEKLISGFRLRFQLGKRARYSA